MSFLDAIVIPIKPRLVFGEKGQLEYFAISYEERILGSLVHLHIRRTGEKEKSLDTRPYHTYFKADAPDFALKVISKMKKNVK